QLAKSIDQSVVEGVLARENPAVGDGVAEQIGGKISLFGHDAEKFVVSFHNETLHQLALLRRHRSRAVEHVLELSAFENDGSEADFVKQLLVVQSLDDDADAAGDGGVVRH